MSVVTLTIDEKLVSAQAGKTVLDAAREAGIDIPTLCHLEGLTPRGGCRLCLVEMEGNPRLLASCVTQVQEGMIIRTHTERIVKYRKMMIELLLAERNHVCAVCVMNGHCELQAMAAKLGVDHVRYDYLNPALAMDASHERNVRDPNRCILCARCVRVCDEVEGAHCLDMMGRGIHCNVITGMNQPWGKAKSCTACGKCVQVCPTGALFKQGATVAEMEKQHDFLIWILDGRDKKIWHWSRQ
ncbi:MAG TPA: bidirectional hydrogenase complex protein HoxU [Syntrophobacteraceae bacterium]|nr:bidirectional hydrogenase complex protein HoxU [Syntrophobacteraceae bacterium]